MLRKGIGIQILKFGVFLRRLYLLKLAIVTSDVAGVIEITGFLFSSVYSITKVLSLE